MGEMTGSNCLNLLHRQTAYRIAQNHRMFSGVDSNQTILVFKAPNPAVRRPESKL